MIELDNEIQIFINCNSLDLYLFLMGLIIVYF